MFQCVNGSYLTEVWNWSSSLPQLSAPTWLRRNLLGQVRLWKLCPLNVFVSATDKCLDNIWETIPKDNPICFVTSLVLKSRSPSIHPSIHPLSVTALSLLWGRRVFAGANPSCLWAKAGYTLDESSAHCRALTDSRGRHARCQLHIRSSSGFSILLKDNSTCSSAQPGAGIWTSDLPITSRPEIYILYLKILEVPFKWISRLYTSILIILKWHGGHFKCLWNSLVIRPMIINYL